MSADNRSATTRPICPDHALPAAMRRPSAIISAPMATGTTTNTPTNAPCSQNGARTHRLAPLKISEYGVWRAMPIMNAPRP